MSTKRVIVITGSGRGIGAATAQIFAERHQSEAIIVINDLNEKNAEEVSKTVKELGSQAVISTENISDYSAAGRLVEKVQSQFGQIDVLINNAGITRDSLLLKMTEAQWDEVTAVNLKGVFNMAQACARVMSEQKSGVMVNLASVSALGNVGQTNYSASKAGVIGMTRTMALELARFQIRVNAIAPGFVDTTLVQQIPEEIRQKLIQKIPLRRMAEPQEIGKLAYFLCSPESSYMTGQCLFMDGGLSVGI